jgi:hypothetical protein
MDDAQIVWLMLGWMLAIWAGKDLQVRFAQWWVARRQRV